MILAAILIAAYFLGSIPVGYLVAKARGVDIRKIGSGNIGATNVQRALGKKASLPVFVLDVAKGFIPALVANLLLRDQTWAFVAGGAAVVGHCLSPFLGFKGGKGIATGLGMLLGSSPLVALCAFGVFVVGMIVTRYVSLSSIIAALTVLPFGLIFRDPPTLLVFYVLLAVFLVVRHKANIVRLRAGTEPKFTFKDPAPAKEKAEPEIVEPAGQEPGVNVTMLLLLTYAAVITSSFMRLG